MRNILIAGAISLILSMVGTPLAIRLFARRGYGQNIREEGPSGHYDKKGTPTMGGTVIVIASLIGYFVAHGVTVFSEVGDPPTASGLLVLFLMTGLGAVGFLDDFIKIYKQRSLGLRSGAKAAGQLVIGAIFAVLVLRFPNAYAVTPAETRVSFLRDIGPSIGLIGFMIWVVFFIVGFSNAVNLTDGLDGLASGATCLVLAAYVLIGNWQLRNSCTTVGFGPNCYWVRDPLDLAVVAAAVLGACLGFLWWNAPPAKIFMGDTGSLALGGVIAGLAFTTRTQLLLVILGGLFAIITMSVIIQVGSFKLTRRRVFRMAPLQHHFELSGWAETTIVVRFWLIAALCVAAGLGLFYLEWMPKQ
ncbi:MULTISPECIES: phospho-N-acetylmuramoyl-pentapeptide-transferase [unclassified Microbispora]|uniref:phospho-N-acetylmuramoyl-pentapeptide- transferase n=1 Tax=unclassified Microbispora TaxID=2614687 RepID=UPI001474EC13|nr:MULTISPECIES: phospho-N-acetylmuramoyl-pentapeptide-transferase [unclassified Microbispora]